MMWIWVRIHLGPWIWIQMYKMKEKEEIYQHFFFVGNYIFMYKGKVQI